MPPQKQFIALPFIALAILTGIPDPVSAQSSVDTAGRDQLVLAGGDGTWRFTMPAMFRRLTPRNPGTDGADSCTRSTRPAARS